MGCQIFLAVDKLKFSKSYRLFLFLLTIALLANSQNDSIKTFALEDLYKLMIEYHPVVKQAKLLSDQAKQEVRMARGSGFDPKFTSFYDFKEFEGKNYFSIWQNSLKIPTWFGAEFKVGYDEIYGSFLNPQNTIPSQGLSYIGVNVPLGQGLIIDQRRAVLRQAQAFQKINDAEKIKLINKIFFEAAKDYWEWYFRYYRDKNLKVAFDLANNRYEFVKKRVAVGEEAAIDSTEALILLQTRIVSYNQAEMELQNSILQLSNHTWSDDNTPVEISPTTKPEGFVLYINKITPEMKDNILEIAARNHPEIKKLEFKIKQLEIEKKLAVENFKPTVNVNYNLLSAGKGTNFEFNSNYLRDFAKYGFDISIPLLYRKERGKFLLTKAKINQTQFEKNYTARTILNEINKYYNELITTERLLETQQKLVNNYIILRNGEIEKFNNGESTLFLVNNRESNLIDSQVKLSEMESKFQKAKAGLYWSAGRTEFE